MVSQADPTCKLVVASASRSLNSGGDGESAKTLEFSPRDIFVVPCWHPYRLEADEVSYLFIGTDRTVQEKFGLFRERRGNA